MDYIKYFSSSTLIHAKLIYLNFHLLEMCPATVTYNFKWLQITHICLISAQKFTSL